jgi:hypothetical protein
MKPNEVVARQQLGLQSPRYFFSAGCTTCFHTA